MKEIWRLISIDVISSLLLLLDLVADLAFLAHLWRNDKIILFYVSLVVLALSLVVVNVLSFMGISETCKNLTSPQLEFLELGWIWQNYRIPLRFTCFVLAYFGFILPHILVIINLIMAIRGSKSEDKQHEDAIVEAIGVGGAIAAVKEVQSVMEPGILIYLKCYYIFLHALLFTKNWPLLFGLSLNIVSVFFGLRKDVVSTTRWPFMAIVVAFINLALRMILILVLAKGTNMNFFFLPLATSIVLLYVWGLLLKNNTCSNLFGAISKDNAPKSTRENIMSSFMYTLFLVPEDIHTAISAIPFTATSIAIACLDSVPIGLRAIMPFAGTLGQLPPRLWWKIARIHNT